MFVQISFNVLRLIIEQKAAQNSLPGHICLVGLVRDCVEEYLEARFDFSETIHAQVWRHIVDYDQLFVADSLLIDQLKYRHEVRVLGRVALCQFAGLGFKSFSQSLLHRS